jgi:hypothetical protein
MKAASLERKGHALRCCGKTFRVFERERSEGVALCSRSCWMSDLMGGVRRARVYCGVAECLLRWAGVSAT